MPAPNFRTKHLFRNWSLGALAVLLLLPATFAQQPPPPPGAYDAAPYLGQVRNTYVYGDIWERPGLSARDRSMITVAVNQALYATNELRLHMGRALDNGVTQAEISEIIAHVLWYSGFPTGVNAARVAAEVFEERDLPTTPPGASSRQPPVDPELEFPGAFPQTPYLRDMLNQLVYAETWKREELSPRDRSMITVAVGTALYASSEVRYHVGRALNNGVTQEEIGEIITHVTFYSGFPTGVNAARVTAEVFEARGLPMGDGRFPAAPYLDELIGGLVYGETWPREQLSARDRSLATIAVTLANYQTDQLRVHLGRGLENGLTTEEISELIAQVTLYSGFPSGVNGSRTFAEVLRERGMPLPD
ncbi:MAG: carboxymuconolactone decarboxylase family protein [Gammaproteobacteria bacterium]|jgi:4-carboxymuconolactone decarboxylase|nr:carboxymuconolactone decarboxylase family protein [Gammaproteobacteria bacterium]MDP6731472.1 carboxymuconolactone decarboxylase family protein [Gammaproteobacteria bacterium]|tara:strand:- start:671 stop:1756 length:1086 start_codon:yes stop_codon:yes gene_type:complete